MEIYTTCRVQIKGRTSTTSVPILRAACQYLFHLRRRLFVVMRLPFLTTILLRSGRITARFHAHIIHRRIIQRTYSSRRVNVARRVLTCKHIKQYIRCPLENSRHRSTTLARHIGTFRRRMIICYLQYKAPYQILTTHRLQIRRDRITRQSIQSDGIRVIHR